MSFGPGWAGLLSLPFLAFLCVPLLALFLRTPLDQLWTNLGQRQVAQALTLSLTTSSLATILSVLLGTPVAHLLARRRFRLRRLVDSLIELPMVLPPAVAGIALLVAFGRRGLIGQYLDGIGINLPFTSAAVVIAQTFVAASLYIKAAMVGFAAIEPELEEAAALDGASAWDNFRYITLPLSATALLTGMVLTWARALGEFGATIIFAGNFPGRTQTMPLAIYIGFELDIGVALTLSVILVGISFLILVLVKWLFRPAEPQARSVV
jgi:molybdate transport system permease protein